MHATDFWATDARKVWGKSRMRATYIPDARNPSNHYLGVSADAHELRLAYLLRKHTSLYSVKHNMIV